MWYGPPGRVPVHWKTSAYSFRTYSVVVGRLCLVLLPLCWSLPLYLWLIYFVRHLCCFDSSMCDLCCRACLMGALFFPCWYFLGILFSFWLYELVFYLLLICTLCCAWYSSFWYSCGWDIISGTCCLFVYSCLYS